jgi:arylsulfatase A-like enzyme
MSIQTGLRQIERLGTSELDDGVGKILAKLRAVNLERNTLACFLSDNGGAQPGRRTDHTPQLLQMEGVPPCPITL